MQINNSWIDITEKENTEYMDFSVNTNPLGVPELVLQKLPEIAAITEFYPDPDCNRLRTMLADKYDISKNYILCGNGADDLLYRLVFALKPRKALIIEPTFEEYNCALQLVGCEVLHYQLRQNNLFDLDEKILTSLNLDIDVVFLCNPNNPTGRLAEPLVLNLIIEKCSENDIILVVDECFIEFIPEWENRTVKQKAALSQNLLVIDAFTKTYALAGFRLGYCISRNQKLMDNMRVCGQEFGVSIPAQFAGICALQDKVYLEKTYSLLAVECEWLSMRLNELGLTVVPSQTNYLLFCSSIADLREVLLDRGVKVRDCSKFYGLGKNYCRIAIRTHNENEKFVATLQDIFSL